MGAGAGAAAAAVAGAEVLAPLLLLCCLCCWPLDRDDSSSEGKHPREPVVLQEQHGSLRPVGSAVSLHLPGPSGGFHQSGWASIRSHDALPGAQNTQVVLELREGALESRHHSAPSIIEEVVERRHWQRSHRDLRPSSPTSPLSTPSCKKHYANIKSSRPKEATRRDYKDADSSETETSFCNGALSNAPNGIAVSNTEMCVIRVNSCMANNLTIDSAPMTVSAPSMYSVPWKGASLKEVKQCQNEAIRVLDDRSGARHGDRPSRDTVFPPPSVEPVGYEGAACYLSAPVRVCAGAGGEGGAGGRPRLASDGDILGAVGAPHRPQSGAFSESDLDLESGDERPPPYEELLDCAQYNSAPNAANGTYSSAPYSTTAISYSVTETAI